jgi:hypothetical protein
MIIFLFLNENPPICIYLCSSLAYNAFAFSRDFGAKITLAPPDHSFQSRLSPESRLVSTARF